LEKIEVHNNLILSQQSTRKAQKENNDDKHLFDYEKRNQNLQQEINNLKYKIEMRNNEITKKNQEIDNYVSEIRRYKKYEEKYNTMKERNNLQIIEIENLLNLKERTFSGETYIK